MPHISPRTAYPVDDCETLLIIDDEDVVRATLSDLFEAYGYRVLESSDGRHGLEVFQQQRENIDLVILDYILPDLLGQEVLDRMLAVDPATRVIIFTGSIEFITCNGSLACIYKSTPFAQLLDTVRQALDAVPLYEGSRDAAFSTC